MALDRVHKRPRHGDSVTGGITIGFGEETVNLRLGFSLAAARWIVDVHQSEANLQCAGHLRDGGNTAKTIIRKIGQEENVKRLRLKHGCLQSLLHSINMKIRLRAELRRARVL